MAQAAISENLRLTSLGGEFVDATREATFRAERLGESVRHARLLFALSAVLNTLFLVSDWRFAGTEHFFLAVGARVLVIFISLVCLLAIYGVRTPVQMEAVSVLWEWVTAVGVALLVSSHSELALFVVLLLPNIFYLIVPVPFMLCVAGGAGASGLLLAGYLDLSQSWLQSWQEYSGLLIALLTLNVALSLVVSRSNRLERLQWAATHAERRANARLRESENRLEQTFQAVPLPLVVTSRADGRVFKFNEAAVRFYHGAADAADTLRVKEAYLSPERRQSLLDQLDAGGRVTDFEVSLRIGDGQVRDVILAAAAIEMDGVPSVVAALVDVTERTAMEQKVRHAATHDPLTGLPNRAAFQNRLEMALAERRMEEGVCLLLVDLDGLKDVNDSLGHDAGDAVLTETARRLAVLAGERGGVARLGGDEFVVMLIAPDALDGGRKLAERIVADLRRPIPYAGRQLVSKASVGLAACPEHDCCYSELMKDADLALYAAKQQGRNRAVVYGAAMRRAVFERLGLLRDMMVALAEDEIVPYYQPKISLATGRLEGFEALVRWRKGPNAVLAPAAFEMALADRDLSMLISERMVQRVTSDVRDWIEAGYDCGRVAINLSPSQFTHRDLAASLLRQFHAGGVEPAHFELEITETVFLGRDVKEVGEILDELRRAGVRVALDDFGTGYAALIHLKQLPIDTIKIDRGFVMDIERDTFDTAIVCAVIDLARNLHIRVVAEGVETTGQARFLRQCGCELAQGFLFYRPMPADDVSALLRLEGDASAKARVALMM